MPFDFSQKRYLTPEAANFLGRQKSTMEAWRFYKTGPAYFRSGGRIFYLESDLVAYLEASRVLPKCGPAAEPVSEKGRRRRVG